MIVRLRAYEKRVRVIHTIVARCIGLKSASRREVSSVHGGVHGLFQAGSVDYASRLNSVQAR